MKLSKLKKPLSLAQKAHLTKGKLKAYRAWLFNRPKEPKLVTTYTGYRIDEKEYTKYKKYLISKAWGRVRKLAFEFYQNNCCTCGSRYNLQVHHRNYKNLYKETMIDVMLLCETCHDEHHRKNKY
jgi:phage terminase large subunit GpA-like protein